MSTLFQEFTRNPGCVKLQGSVQHYAWGGYRFIPDLVGLNNSEKKPHAELWLGAHPKAPATAVINEQNVPLTDLIDNATTTVLGKKVISQFGKNLPFLFKVLDVRDMLSIQVHPSKNQAENGFSIANEKNIALDAPNRSYKDANHKPEVHVALTDFWMLHGFRPEDDIARQLKNVPEFAELLSVFEKKGLKGLYSTVMRMPQNQVDEMLNPLIERLENINHLDKDHPDYWARQAAESFPLPKGHRDRGLFSIYLFNLLHLKPGQGTFQPAGVPHAYLQGVNIELMANSDNVLRGGLTKKYIDVEALLDIVDYQGREPEILTGQSVSPREQVYPVPVSDFQLSRISLVSGDAIQLNEPAPSIGLVMDGIMFCHANGSKRRLERGDAFFIPAATNCRLISEYTTTLYRATVPVT